MGTRADRSLLWLLLCGMLTACAATQSALREEIEQGEEAVSFDEACAEQGAHLALCDTEQCEWYSCREVMENLLTGQVVLARTGGTGLPGLGNSAQRYWGSAQAPPKNSQPVFIIPWGSKPPQQLLPSQKLLLEELEAKRRKPHERHHIFSQEKGLKEWFISKGIDIHEYTLLLELAVHRGIHQAPPQGGPWNEAWRKYKDANFNASKQEIMRHAGQLIYEFKLFGPVIPYRMKLPQPPAIQGH
jgi:uncharacterized lipoprotein (TIGR02269 family)